MRTEAQIVKASVTHFGRQAQVDFVKSQNIPHQFSEVLSKDEEGLNFHQFQFQDESVLRYYWVTIAGTEHTDFVCLAPPVKPIPAGIHSNATKEQIALWLGTATRESMIAFLIADDRNGCYSDKDCVIEGIGVMTRADCITYIATNFLAEKR